MKAFVNDAAVIAAKELKQLRRDPVSLILTIMFPIILISNFIVISTALSPVTPHAIPIVVADLDQTPTSKELVRLIAASNDIVVTQYLDTEEQAFQVVNTGGAEGAVVIPQGFANAVARGDAYISIEMDNSKPSTSSVASAAVTAAAQNILSESQLGEITNLGVKIAPVEVITRPISGRPISGEIILPGFLGLIVILGAFDDIANAITRERERGTFPRLILSPVSLLAIYSGKMAATIVLTIIRTALMLMIFRLDGLVVRGSLFLVFLTTTLIAIFTISLGLVITSRVRRSSTLTILEIAMTFPLFSLAGTTQSPLLLAPGGIRIANSLPWTYGNDALRRIIYLGIGLNRAVVTDLLILLVSSMILLPIAIQLSKRTM
jgi:ABC-2 type transport system permease protein